MRHRQNPSPAGTAGWIRRRCGRVPQVGIILGSGFGAVASEVAAEATFPFQDLPGFPVGSVAGHRQQLILGHWMGLDLAVLQGRAHYYEGFDMDRVTFPVRVLAELGIRALLVTNAAGGIHPRFRPGDFMVLKDHINGMGANPLRGPVPAGRSRFVDLTRAYDPGLQRHLRAAAKAAGTRCHAGVYLAVSGPSYETPAEIRAFRRLGADAVGMSTVPEALAARQCGISVAGLSCITNAAAGLAGRGVVVSHEEVLETARQRESEACRLVAGFLKRLGRSWAATSRAAPVIAPD